VITGSCTSTLRQHRHFVLMQLATLHLRLCLYHSRKGQTGYRSATAHPSQQWHPLKHHASARALHVVRIDCARTLSQHHAADALRGLRPPTYQQQHCTRLTELPRLRSTSQALSLTVSDGSASCSVRRSKASRLHNRDKELLEVHNKTAANAALEPVDASRPAGSSTYGFRSLHAIQTMSVQACRNSASTLAPSVRQRIGREHSALCSGANHSIGQAEARVPSCCALRI
jgi:hypothetical protein